MYLKEAEMKIAMFAHFKEYHGNHKKMLGVYMILGDAVSKLETFVWILNQNFKVLSLVSVHPKSIIIGQMTNLNFNLIFSCGGVSLSIC